MKVRNTKIKRIKSLVKYKVYYDYVVPKNEISGKQGKAFTELTVNEVAVIKAYISKDFQIILDIFFDGMLLDNIRIFDLWQFQKWLMNELKVRHEREKQLEIIDAKMIQAGSNELARFGILNTKIALAEQFSTTPQLIGEWKHDFVFNILLYNKVMSNVRKNVNNIK